MNMDKKSSHLTSIPGILIFLVAACFMNAAAASTPNPVEATVARATRLYRAGQTDSALVCYSRVIQRYYRNTADTSVHRAAANAFAAVGNIYTQRGYYGKAYENLATGISLAEERGLKRPLILLYNNMSALWETSNQLLNHDAERHSKYLKKAYWLSVELSDQRNLEYIVDNMLMAADATTYAKEIADFRTQRLRRLPELAYTRTYLEMHDALLRGDTATAYANLEKAVSIARPSDPVGLLNAMLTIAQLQSRQGQNTKARHTLQQMRSEAIRLKQPQYLTMVYAALCDNYAAVGMADSAQQCRYRVLEMRDTLQRRSENNLTGMELTREIERVNQELRHMSLVRQQRERQLVWVGALALLLLMGAMWVWQSYRIKMAHIRELYLQNINMLRQAPEPVPPASILPPSTSSSEHCADIEEGQTHGSTSAIRKTYADALEAMASSPEPLTPDFTLAQLSTLTGIHTRILSQAINECAHCRFPQFVNEYRIREACRRFNDTANYGQFTIEAIGQSVGLSRTSFHRMFKKTTGLTPAQYREAALKEKSHSS